MPLRAHLHRSASWPESRWLTAAMHARVEQPHRVAFYFWRQVRVPHGHRDRCVAKQFLNCLKRHAAHHQMTCEGVPACMPTDAANARSFDRPPPLTKGPSAIDEFGQYSRIYARRGVASALASSFALTHPQCRSLNGCPVFGHQRSTRPGPRPRTKGPSAQMWSLYM